MALMQISVIPVGTDGPSVGEYIADIERHLRSRNIDHSLNDMGTIVYGPPERLFQLAAELHDMPFKRGALRVVTQVSIDDRRDTDRKIGEKRQSVMARLQDTDE